MRYKTYNNKQPLTITPEVKQEIEKFKQRLIEMAAQPDETSAFDAQTIHLIMNELDDYNRNILLAYYSVAGCSPAVLARLFNVSHYAITSRIRRIINLLHNANTTTKSRFNMPRVCVDY